MGKTRPPERLYGRRGYVAVAAASDRLSLPSSPPRRHSPRARAAPFAAAEGTASDAASAAKPPPVAAAAGGFVIPATIAAVVVFAAAEDVGRTYVGGAWEAGRARVRGACAGVFRFGILAACFLFASLFYILVCTFLICVSEGLVIRLRV